MNTCIHTTYINIIMEVGLELGGWSISCHREPIDLVGLKYFLLMLSSIENY